MSCSMTSKFFYAERPFNSLTQPEDVIPYLANLEHWKKGCSAYELTHSWMTANGIPDAVRTVLDQADEFRCMELIKGFFEKRTHLRSHGTPSQTDLLALIGDGAVSAVLGIEGKVKESFDQLVSEWSANASENKQIRLTELCRTLGLMSTDVCKLRYQLIHRTAAAVYEAQCHNVRQAVMFVHSFSKEHRGFDDFQAFAEAMNAPVSNINELSCEVEVESISLRLGWVADTVAS